MAYYKNVANQKVTFVMVDKTDFATPEAGITVAGVIRKDGGASTAIANTVSELTNGLYVLTLTNSEMNADNIILRFHDSGASCAQQVVTIQTDQAKITSILTDTGTTLDDKIDSILADTKEINSQCDSILADTITLSNATYGLDALETIVSDILEALDSVVAGPIASILVDTNATLDNKIDSILADTTSILVDTTSILVDTTSILVDTGTTLDNKVDSILADTITLSNADYGLNAIETIASDILEALDSVVAGPLASILVDTNTTLDNKLDSILVDTGTTLLSTVDHIVSAIDSAVAGPIASILADTITLSNADYGLDALETLSSAILSTIDGAGIKPTTAEPAAGAPAVNAATGVKIDHLYTLFRNKIETTSGTQKVYDDAGTTVLYSCALSDDATTFTKGEHA